MNLKLVRHQGKPVVRHASKRPYYAYYYMHGKALGYDKIGRATDGPRAIAAATRKILKDGYMDVVIYFEDESVVAELSIRYGKLTIKLRYHDRRSHS